MKSFEAIDCVSTRPPSALAADRVLCFAFFPPFSNSPSRSSIQLRFLWLVGFLLLLLASLSWKYFFLVLVLTFCPIINFSCTKNVLFLHFFKLIFFTSHVAFLISASDRFLKFFLCSLLLLFFNSSPLPLLSFTFSSRLFHLSSLSSYTSSIYISHHFPFSFQCSHPHCVLSYSLVFLCLPSLMLPFFWSLRVLFLLLFLWDNANRRADMNSNGGMFIYIFIYLFIFSFQTLQTQGDRRFVISKA